MIRHIRYEGRELPVDFNIMTLMQLAKRYDTDLSGLREVFASFTDEMSSITFIANVGAIALTEGARRTAHGAEHERYDVDRLYDMLTVDMSISEQLLTELFSSMEGSKVFPTAVKNRPPKKKNK